MQLLDRPGEEKIHLEPVKLSRGRVVNSFGQFTGDVRVSGHISQAGGGGAEGSLRLQISLLEMLIFVLRIVTQLLFLAATHTLSLAR